MPRKTTYAAGVGLMGWILAGLLGCASPGGYYQNARLLQNTGRLDEAVPEYYRALQAQPGRVDVYVGLSEALAAKGLAAESLQALEQARQLAPQDQRLANRLAEAYFRRGQEYQKDGKISDAYETWQKALQLDPAHAATRAGLAQLYTDKGQDQEAAQQYESITQSQPQDTEAHQSLGLTYYRQGKLNEALAEFQQVLRLDPRDASAYNNLGSVYLKLGRVDEALAAFEQAAGINPKLAVTHTNWGTAFFQQGRYERARQEWELALQLEPANETAQRNLDSLTNLGF